MITLLGKKRVLNSRLEKLEAKEELPKDYIKTVNRMRTAIEKKERSKRLREHIPRGEGYERRKNQRVRVPSCATRKKRRQRSLLCF